MFDLALDLVNAVNIKITLFPYDFGTFLGDHTEFRQGITGMGFDLEPDLEF